MADTDEKPVAKGADKSTDAHGEALKRWQRAMDRERENIDLAYEDMRFRAGEQWPESARLSREADDRPILTINRIPQFVRQVTGDIRQMRPSIKAVAIDDRGNTETAETLSGMIRYIENRSDARQIYTAAADSMVSCGIGHWKVIHEYAEDTTFDQELGIELIEDGISVLWDPDAVHPTRRDAMFCFEHFDISHDAFKERWPDADMGSIQMPQANVPSGWWGEDYIRVCRYWYKKPFKRLLAIMPDGSIDDLTNDDPEKVKRVQDDPSVKIEKRDGYKVCQRLMMATEFIEEEKEWPGRYIPIVPAIGEEVRIARRRYRHGIIRYAKDPQRAYNYYRSTQAEYLGLAPKTPYIGTEENFKDYEAEWATANTKAHPYLPFKPDPKNGGAAPQRSQPPTTSPGLTEAVAMADNDMKAVIGIYDASLGNRSNETSGVAIKARQREGDTGTFVYIDNFALSVAHTGRILLDMIPHIYDTQRIIRVVGEDGVMKTAKINTPQGIAVDGQNDAVLNDVTIGAYDVSMEMGPSYNTKREEARDGMAAFMQANPQTAQAFVDLFAKMQDWPLAKQVAERAFMTYPQPMQQAIITLTQDEDLMRVYQALNPPPDPNAPPPPPPPEMVKMQADMAKAEADMAKARAEIEAKQLANEHQRLVNLKAEFDVLLAQMKLGEVTDLSQMQSMLAEVDEAVGLIGQHVAMSHPEPEPPMQEAMEPPQMQAMEPNEITPASAGFSLPESEMPMGDPNFTQQADEPLAR